jgi:RHS repeat-associated protein
MRNGEPFWFNYNADGQWHTLIGDLSPYAGRTPAYLYAGMHNTMLAGVNDTWVSSMTIVRTDGAVDPIFNGQGGMAVAWSNYGATSDISSAVEDKVVSSDVGTTYYISNHLGSVQFEMGANGAPTWSGHFTPFGQDLAGFPAKIPVYSQTADGIWMRFRFTGKERDTESGLDYFGARYMSSNMGRWMSPDTVNVTEDRMLNPSSTLNKYAYGANNPLKYTDPDGKDITIFYEAANPFAGSPGHTMLLAYDQSNGNSAVRSFGPDYANGASVLGTIPGTPGTDTFGFENIKSPDDLRANFTSITIQTTPEEAEAVIAEIKAHPDGNYTILSHNCTTTCSRLLRSIGKTKSHALYPGAFFDALYDRYGHPHATGRIMPHTFANGATYGNLRPGYNPFQLFFNDIHCTTVTSTIRDSAGNTVSSSSSTKCQ